jgi:hypothetical protein
VQGVSLFLAFKGHIGDVVLFEQAQNVVNLLGVERGAGPVQEHEGRPGQEDARDHQELLLVQGQSVFPVVPGIQASKTLQQGVDLQRAQGFQHLFLGNLDGLQVLLHRPFRFRPGSHEQLTDCAGRQVGQLRQEKNVLEAGTDDVALARFPERARGEKQGGPGGFILTPDQDALAAGDLDREIFDQHAAAAG